MHHKIIKLTQITLAISLLSSSAFAYYKTTLGPCRDPINFKLRDLDHRFGLSREEAVTHLKNGANIWNSALYVLNKKKKIFEYNDNAKDAILVDFVFDERQSTTIKNNILKELAESKKSKLDLEKKSISFTLSDLESKKIEYDREVAEYEKDLARYNARVTEINNNGGASFEQMEEFNSEKEYLDKKRGGLVERGNKLGAEVKIYNGDVTSHNNQVAEVNELVSEINNSSIGLFEEGYYKQGQVVIYEYGDHKVLERLIAHELGHARGMEHVKDENALMYYINSSQNTNLTTDDIDQYKKICKLVN